MFSGPLEDRVAIQELNGTYADGVVRADADTWATVWADDAYWNLMGMEVTGRDAIVAMWKGAMGGLEAVSFHCVPCMIAVEGERATSRVQTQEIMRINGSKTRVIGGLYEDELVRREGRWLFTSRKFRIVAEYNPEGAA